VGVLGPYLTVAEAAAYLRAKPQRVYDLLSARQLSRHKDGRRVLISRAELDNYLAGIGSSRVAPALPPISQGRLRRGLDT
jgi:excisionase family DNA binding protein